MKNTLQEKFQKLKLKIPTYETRKMSFSADHEPQFCSKVFISSLIIYPNEKETNICINGLPQKRKVDAETSAAEYALQFIGCDLEKSKAEKSKAENVQVNDKRTGIFIDAENLPNMIPVAFDLMKRCTNIRVYIFIGKYHHAAEKILQMNPTNEWNIEIIEVDSSRKDGVDCAIQMYVGKFLDQQIIEKYIIVTRDHFGHTLAELIETSKLSSGRLSAVATTKNQLEEECLY